MTVCNIMPNVTVPLIPVSYINAEFNVKNVTKVLGSPKIIENILIICIILVWWVRISYVHDSVPILPAH